MEEKNNALNQNTNTLSNTVITEEQVRQALKQVEDPELHIDIVTLELVYKIQIQNNNVNILMTLTSPGCPYGHFLVEMAKSAVQKIPHVSSVNVHITFEPMWQPSEELKAMMGLL